MRAVFLMMVAPLLLVSGCMTPGGSGFCDYAPLASTDKTVQGADRMRAAGPVFERIEQVDGSRITALRPLFTHVSGPAEGDWLTEVLWPIATFRQTRGQSLWRVILAQHTDRDISDPQSRHKMMIYPLYYSGIDDQGQRYWALFPLGGKIHKFLWLDKFEFVLFPLFGRAENNGTQSTYILWPILTWAHGGGVRRFRVFPLYGFSENGEDWRKSFYLWPFLTTVKYGGKHPSGGGFILFPLFGRVKLEDQSTWMFLPPICRFSSNDRGYRLRQIWPFFQYERDGESGRTFLWPLWGHRYWPNRDVTFFAWPFIRHESEDRATIRRSRFRFFPFYHQERTYAAGEPSQETDAAEENELVGAYTCIWPLFSHRLTQEGHSRVRVPDLWPLPRMSQVERNYAPFWSLYQRQRAGEEVEHELLWGLFRWRKGANKAKQWHLFPLCSYASSGADQSRKRWSLLGGLAGRQRIGDAVSWRLGWFFELGDDLSQLESEK